MSYCINPKCPHPQNPENVAFCQNCGSQLHIEGRYWVIREIGRGGFGKTYEVNEQGKAKVLKVLTHTEPVGVRLFQQEANVLMCLRHPGLPLVESNGYFTFRPNNSQESLHCLVMEKIEGVNLQEWLRSRNHQPLGSEQAIEWLEQLARILHLVHSQSYFHRDIKPQNIMLRLNGQLVLIDFGAVRQITESYELKLYGQITRIVSLGYTPPEQIHGKAEPRSDFFALGRTFVELLTGQHPINIPEESKGGLNWRSFAPQVSKPLADFIDELISASPENRPRDTTYLLQRIERLKPRAPSSSKSEQDHVVFPKNILIPLGLVTTLGLLALGFILRPQPPEQKLLSYVNSEQGFSMKYPEQWDKQEPNVDIFNKDAVRFISPLKNQAKEEVTVSVETLKAGSESLDEYTQSAMDFLKQNPNVTILDESSTILANNSAHKVVFRQKDGEKILKKMQVWTIKNNTPYIITYIADNEEYDDSFEAAEKMIASLSIN